MSDVRTYDSNGIITRSNVEERTGEPLEVWHDRIWETMAERGYLFLKAIGEDGFAGDGCHATTRMHLPAEFPYGKLTAHQNLKVPATGNVVNCYNHAAVSRWCYKTPACVPPGHKKICSYCLHDYVEWYTDG